MDLLLTDFLTCPHCGPAFGLVLLAERVEARRIIEGELGCPNCRELYPVRGGFGDFRSPPAGQLPSLPAPIEGTAEETFRLTALMGLVEGPGYALMAGSGTRMAPGVAGLAKGIEVITLDPALAACAERPGISRIVAGGALPFRGTPLRAAALTAGADPPLLSKAARLVARGGRIFMEAAPSGAAAELESLGFEVLAREGSTVVAARR